MFVYVITYKTPFYGEMCGYYIAKSEEEALCKCRDFVGSDLLEIIKIEQISKVKNEK